MDNQTWIQSLNNTVGDIGGIVWGPYMLALLVGTGIFLTIRLGLLQFHMLPYALKQAFWPQKKKADGPDQEGDVSHFAALMTALSATIGTGNIAGVATAVATGGPGAVFWMWMTALVGMATKYGEGVLAVKYRISSSNGEMSGGPMYYIERGLKQKWLAVTFALMAVLASFGIGSSVQSNSVADAVYQSFNISPLATGFVLTLLTGVVVLGGIRWISTAASFIVPLMAVGYVLGGLAIMLLNWDMVGPAFRIIMSDAFSAQAVAGGTLGSMIRYGVARGVFSNEAGMGSAPIAAAAAKTDHPVRQALVSMTGTFLDTVVVCSITGIVLVMGLIHMQAIDLQSGVYVQEIQGGAGLTVRTFNHLLPGDGGMLVTIGLIFFAYSTILGWCYYGEKCASYLMGDRMVPFYRFIYVMTVLLGCMAVQTGSGGFDQAGVKLVWDLADTFNGLMAIPNLCALLLLSGVIVAETRDFAAKRKSGELE